MRGSGCRHARNSKQAQTCRNARLRLPLDRNGAGARTIVVVGSLTLARRTTASGQYLEPTHSTQRRFSQRTTGLPWNLTFAHAAEKVGDDNSGRSHMPTDDRDKFGAERLHPIVTN